jgi:phage gp29-like protein
MAGLDRRVFNQLPYAAFSGVDNNVDVEGILRSFEFGNMRGAALFADQMLRDDRISGVLSTRAGGLLASPLNVKPANMKRKADKVAKMLSGDEGGDGLWDEFFPPSFIGEMLRWGHMLGIAVAEIIWKARSSNTGPTDVKPWLRVWHPQFIYWRWDTFSYWIITGDGVFELPKVDENPQSDGKWVVWCPRGYTYGWQHGLIRPLARPYLARAWNSRDWSRYCEVYGSPMKQGIVPPSANEQVKDDFKRDLMAAGADGVIITPQGGDSPQGKKDFDVKFVEAKSRGYQTFMDFKAALDTDIAITIIGQNLTTEATGGGLGGAKAADVHDAVRSDYKAQDGRIAKVLREQVLTHWTAANIGDPDLTPRPQYETAPGDEENEDALAMKTLGDGIAALKLAGAPLDVRTIVDRAGYPMLTEEEIAAKEADDAAKTAAALPPPPGGPAGGAGGVDPPAPGAPKPPPPKGTPPAPGDKAAALSGVPVTRYQFQGLPIAVENPAGSIRLWTDDQGKNIGATKMHHDYGYIEGHVGADAEELDAYVGPDEDAPDVHVVRQLATPDYKAHDEDKIMLGFRDAGAAKAAFLAHRNDGEKSFGGMSTIPMDAFKAKLQRRTGTGAIRASVDLSAAAMREEVVALSASVPNRTSAGKRRASRYMSALTAKATKRGAAAMSVDLALLKGAVDSATTPAELRAKLIDIAKGQDPARLAAIIQKSRILANLAGRDDILGAL